MPTNYRGLHTITQGDTFGLPMWLHDQNPDLPYPVDDPRRGYLLDENIRFNARIVDQNRRVICQLDVVNYPNQAGDGRGWVLYKTDEDTSHWPVGSCFVQVKTTISNSVRSTEYYEFLVIGDA